MAILLAVSGCDVMGKGVRQVMANVFGTLPLRAFLMSGASPIFVQPMFKVYIFILRTCSMIVKNITRPRHNLHSPKQPKFA